MISQANHLQLSNGNSMPQFIQREFVPDELKDVYVDFYWSQKKLWELEIPVTELEISQLDWILDYPVWYMDPHPIPNKILQNPELDLNHWKRIEAADLSFPIHILKWKNRWLILDGVHRLIKAKSAGAIEIRTKILEESHISLILPTKDDFESGFLKQFKGRE